MVLNRYITITLFLFYLSWFAGGAYAESIPSGMQELGKGQAYYLKFIKVYDATLYRSELIEEKDILSSDVSKCLTLDYSVDVGKADFIKAATVVLNQQFTQEQLVSVENEIETLHQSYLDVRDGDNYTLCYDSVEEVTSLSYNGSNLVAINSAPFAEIYFSIWLGSDNPLDKNLRDDLLTGLFNN